MYSNWYSCLRFPDTKSYDTITDRCHLLPHFPPLSSSATFSTPAFSVAPLIALLQLSTDASGSNVKKPISNRRRPLRPVLSTWGRTDDLVSPHVTCASRRLSVCLSVPIRYVFRQPVALYWSNHSILPLPHRPCKVVTSRVVRVNLSPLAGARSSLLVRQERRITTKIRERLWEISVRLTFQQTT